MRIFVLGTSSKGNSTFVQLGNKKFLFDLGFSYKQIKERLEMRGESVDNLDGVFITHEHQDHIKGLKVFFKNHHIKLYISRNSYNIIREQLPEDIEIEFIKHLKLIKDEEFDIVPFYLKHDSAANFGFYIRDIHGSLLMFYDTGELPMDIIKEISVLDVLLIETNYDIEMLMGSNKYPWYLKQRIMSTRGHLSNEQAKDLFNLLIERNLPLKYIIPFHMSEENNNLELVKQLFSEKILREKNIKFVNVYPEKPSEVIEL